MTNTLPRKIKPELIEVGDTIVASYPEDHGITTRKEGTVKRIERYAGSVIFLAEMGAPIARYNPGMSNGVSFILMKRAAVEQTPLSLFEQVAERV